MGANGNRCDRTQLSQKAVLWSGSWAGLVSMRHILQSGLLISALSLGLVAGSAAATRPVVLELFTSEGCSSCPPAELIINELALRAEVLPLSFHVDYWDGLGWRDRYSLASATERQRGYARALHRPSVYTPQAVIDGSKDMVGSHRAVLMEAISARREGIATTISLSEGRAQIHVGGAASGMERADVLLVGYLREAITSIGRGENSGRTLKESNIVISLQKLGHWNGKPQEFVLDVSKLSNSVTDIAVLVQSVGQGPILGAATQSIR
jgi:hypothetical protein